MAKAPRKTPEFVDTAGNEIDTVNKQSNTGNEVYFSFSKYQGEKAWDSLLYTVN